MLARGAKLLVIGNIMKPQQIYKVNEYMQKFGLEAWDRVDLILKIFERHATTTEAKLQIELAAIKHM
jgi:GTPase